MTIMFVDWLIYEFVAAGLRIVGMLRSSAMLAI